MKLQLEKEKVFDKGAEKIKNDKVLIVCDRGMLDNKAYMTEEEFKRALKELGINEVEIRDNYDAVFHLVTAAKGADKFYNLDNAARTETKEEAKTPKYTIGVVTKSKSSEYWMSVCSGMEDAAEKENAEEMKEKRRKILEY